MTSPSESHGVQATPTDTAHHAVQTAPDAHGPDSTHGHDHAEAPQGPLFSDKEWKEFRDDDVHAGGAIVALMGSIFLIGLMLYSTIAIIVAA